MRHPATATCQPPAAPDRTVPAEDVGLALLALDLGMPGTARDILTAALRGSRG